jgi:hypothetical protein
MKPFIERYLTTLRVEVEREQALLPREAKYLPILAWKMHDACLASARKLRITPSLLGVEGAKLSSNGMITNDKFCMSRQVWLHLSHWRLAQCLQQNVAARVSYPSDRDESTLRHRGGINETTPMEMPPSASGTDGSTAPLG